MIFKNISALLLTAVIAVSLPNTTNAYFTQEQTQTALTPITAMYTITYSFGLPKQDIYLPTGTQRNLMHGESDRTLGYTIREDGEDITDAGDVAGVVLSNAEVKDGMYFVPKGSKASFTLVVLLRTQPNTPKEDYSLLVENLPFLVDMGGESLQVRDLNPSELQYYATDEVRLNDVAPVDIEVTNITVNPSTVTVTPNGK